MYEWAMNIWNMDAESFQEWLIWVLIIAFFLYEMIAEIRINRLKRYVDK